MLIRSLALTMVLACVPAAWAEDEPTAPSRIGLPHASLSYQPEPGWQLTQFDGAVLELNKDGARLWAYAAERGGQASKRVLQYARRIGGKFAEVEAWNIRGIRDASRFWHAEGGEHRMLGALTRDDDTGLNIEGLVPKGKAALVTEMRKICDSFDANPFVHPERVVHWDQGWTLDLAQGWRVDKSQGGWVHLKHADGIEAYVGDGVKDITEMLKNQRRFRASQFLNMVPSEPNEVDVLIRAKSKDDSSFWLRQRVFGDVHAALIHPFETDKQVTEAAMAMLRTLRKGTDPGPQRDLAEERFPTRFPRADGPPLTFTFPMQWKLSKATSSMRLAQFTVPGKPEALTGVVFWFGAGQGGTVSMNMKRWIGHFESLEPPVPPEPVEVSEGIRATTLDITGTYVAETRPGSNERVNRPDQRMLACVLEAPQGPVFLKLVGEAGAVGRAAKSFHAWVKSFRVATKK